MLIPYDENIDSIETGDIFFEYDNSLISRIIRLVTRSHYSQVGMFVSLGGVPFVVESIQWKGCVMQPVSTRFNKSTFTKVKTGMTLDLNDILRDVGNVESDYIGAILSPFYRSKGAKQYCAEWVANKLGLSFDNINRNIYPEDIFEYFDIV